MKISYQGHLRAKMKTTVTVVNLAKCVVVLFLALLCFSQLTYAESLTYTLRGLPEEISENVNHLLSKDLQRQEPLTDEKIANIYNKAPTMIQKGIEPFGYFHPEITPKRLKQVKPGRWRASYDINLGKPVIITQLNVRIEGPGNQLRSLKRTLSDLPLQLGHHFAMKAYDDSKDLLLNEANEQGFLDAFLSQHQVLINRKENTCTIDLVLKTGPQYYLGGVSFKGTTYDKKFLQRYLPFQFGDRYTADALQTLQESLTHSVYFTNVSVHPEDPTALVDDIVPVEVILEERKSKHYTFGVGYGTDTGIRSLVGLDRYHITNNGHYFKSYAQLSPRQSQLQARYIIPGENPVSDQYYVGANIEQQDISHNRGDTQKVSVGRIDNYHSDWQRTLSLGYQLDYFSINDAPYQHTHNLIPGISVQKTHFDNVIFPRKGYSLTFSSLAAVKNLLSTSNFIQLETDMLWINQIAENGRLVL